MRGHKAQSAVIVSLKNKKLKCKNDFVEARERNEPKIKTMNLRCPKHLPLGAQKEWRRIVKLYKELDKPIINDLDLTTLEVYCVEVDRYNIAIQKVQETSEVIKINGQAKINPWLKVANDASEKIRKFGELLLLDPVSRARVGLAKAKQEEDPDAYMFGD